MTFSKTLIREVMNPAPITIRSDAHLIEAAACMFDQGRTCLIVALPDANQGWGILTQKDVLVLMSDMGVELEGLLVSDVMTHPTVTLPPHYSVATAIQLMRMLGVRRAAVVDGAELVGFVSFTDLFAHAMESARAQA